MSVEIGDFQGQLFESLELLVDAGASDTVVPKSILERLGVAPQETWPFTLADERVIEYEIGQTSMRMNGTTRIVTVVFGDHDAVALLGASALETFHLAADPVRKRLIPVPGILM